MSILQGWYFATAWGWFMVPLCGVKIGVINSVGLTLLIRSILPMPEQNPDKIFENIRMAMFLSTLLFIMMWGYHFFL